MSIAISHEVIKSQKLSAFHNPKLSVIVASYNNSAVLDKCIQSWHTYARDQPIEIIVIADGCVDNTIDVLERWIATSWGKERIKYFVEQNVHELLCTNRGMKEAKGELYLSWHDDMFLCTHFFVPEIIRTFDSYQELGLLGLCRGLLCHSASMPNSWTELTEPNRLESTVGSRFFNWFRIYEIDAVMRPWITRRRCIEKVGYMDERFKLSEWDEADLCFRIHESGWKIATHAYERLHAYTHLGSSTISKTNSESYRQQVLLNGQLFYSRWSKRIVEIRDRKRMSWRRNFDAKAFVSTVSRLMTSVIERCRR